MSDISNISNEATELTNTTGQPDPILEISPQDGLIFEVLAAVARGRAPGVPVYMDLRDSNNDPLPVGTSVRLEFEAPGDKERSRVSKVRDNIQPWNNLTISDQQDEEYVDRVKIELLGERIIVRDIDSLYVTIESSTQIDWSNSAVYVEGNAVNEYAEN